MTNGDLNTNRTFLARFLFILIFACCGAFPTTADDQTASPFVGEWCNKDFATGGVTRVHVRQEGTKIIAHMWGRCHPTECDWGESTATIDEDGKILSIVWITNFDVVTQKLTLHADGTLQITGHTHFTDESGREDYVSKAMFTKGLTHDWGDLHKK